MLQVRSEQIQNMRKEINLSFRYEIISLLAENGYETIENPATNDIGIKDKGNNTSWLRYNEQAQPSIFELPSGTTYHLRYFPDGALQSVLMPNGNAIELLTQDGKLLNLKHKGGSSLSLKYTKDHKISEVIVGNKKKYRFEYDKTYGYFNAIIDGNKQKKIFNHDNSGNLRQKIDAENRTTYFHYEVGEEDLRYIQYPDGSRETYRFDEDGNYLEITQRNNAWVKNHYDDNDNLRQVEWQDGSFMLLEYDEKEEISSIQNEHSLINFKKDNQGQIVEEEGEFGSIKYEYDKEERLSKVIYPDNYEVKYSYDIDGELSEVKDSEGNTNQFTYDAKSATSKIIFGNGNVEYATREHFNGQMAETSLNIQSGNCYGQTYEYDNQERLAKILDAKSKFPSRTLHYDDADHLLAVKADKEKVVEQFTYDRSGQLTSANSKNIVIGSMEETKVYGENVLGYDSNGHLSDFLGVKATFKHNNTLDKLEAKGQEWYYKYDAFGRRISKSNGRETTQYVWAGVQLYEEIRIGNGIETRQKYLYRPFEQRPFAIKNEKGVYLLQQDQRGAVIRAVNSFGKLAWEAEYDAFGKAYIRTEKIHQPWRLQGQYFDAESDLHYNVGRYYSPMLKTYLSLDPMWYEIESSNYNYSNNDPYNKADPLGQNPVLVAIGVVRGVIIIGRGVMAIGRGAMAVGRVVASNPLVRGYFAYETGNTAFNIGDYLINGANDTIKCTKELAVNAVGLLPLGFLLNKVKPLRNLINRLARSSRGNKVPSGNNKPPKGKKNAGGNNSKQSLPNKKTGISHNIDEIPVASRKKAQEVIEHAKNKNGATKKNYRGNRGFDNDGRDGTQILPKTDANGNPVTYTEYDIHPHQKGVNRGNERVVMGTDGSSYYTDNHYYYFIKIE